MAVICSFPELRLHLRFDSDDTTNSVNSIALNKRFAPKSHEDVWNKLTEHVTQHDSHFCATWIKGHAKEKHVKDVNKT